ncbi:MAG: efflux RND transporter periplasmic adaptor subunit [Proteobacteria bacterium]|nr:efflux RND transporter periplasmic adaptor subunit [Pseudomonadota bacterium]
MRAHFWAHAALGAGAIGLALAGCTRTEQAAPAPKAPAGQRLVLAAQDTVDWQDVSAEITTVDQAQVIARIPGILAALSVKEGDLVHKGQVIGRVVDSQLGFQSQAASAMAGQARAELARVRFLYQNGVYAKARLDQAEAMAASANAQHAASRAVVGQGAVIAPASGRVLHASIPAGAPVAPGMALAVITAGPTIVRLEMPESLAGKVHAGSRVMAAGLPEGRIVKVYPAVDAGKVSADVELPGIDNSLIGRRVAARVATGTRKALLVPAGFITTRYGLDTITILARDGSASQVPVQTAPSAEAGKIEILSGANAGDTLLRPLATGAGSQ